MPPDQDAISKWEPSDYILYGRHCPKEVIQQTLRSTMRALGAEQIIHIAFDDQGVIGSLSFVLEYPERLGETLNKLLERAASDRLVQSLIAVVHSCSDEAILSADSARLIATEVATMTLPGYSLSKAEAEQFIGRVHSGLCLTHAGSQQFTSEIGDMRSVILIDVVPMSTGLLRSVNLPHQLAVQLKSTAEASVLSDMAIAKLVAERFDTHDRSTSENFFPDIAAKALSLGLDVTNSDSGAVYLISTMANYPFELLVTSDAATFPAQIPPHMIKDLIAVTSRNLTLQRGDWRPETSDEGESASHGGVILFVPIGGPDVDPDKPAIGVLALRRADQTHAFSAYDLALIRNVALRISLARTTDAMARIGAVTSVLQAPTDWLATQKDVSDESQDHRMSVAIPIDVRMAGKRIQPALAELATLTDSHSVSLRLALPSAEAKQSHGLALVRVASHPGRTATSGPQVMTEDIGGFGWTCVNRNQIVYSPEISREFQNVRIRSSTTSELAVPVREEGRLVGVLSLESSLADAYSPVLPLITSFADAVGRTLADARAAVEVSVIDNAAQVLNHRHTMESHFDRLEQRIHAASVDKYDELLRSELVEIRSELYAMRHVASREATEIATVPQVLERAAERVGYLGALPKNMWMDEFAKPVNGMMVEALQIVVTNILSNLMNYTAISEEGSGKNSFRKISMATSYFEDQSQIVIIFQNYADEYVNPARIADLYRGPVLDHGGRLRIGGFLAGINARRANARLQSTLLNDGRTVRTTLIVPIGKLGG